VGVGSVGVLFVVRLGVVSGLRGCVVGSLVGGFWVLAFGWGGKGGGLGVGFFFGGFLILWGAG